MPSSLDEIINIRIKKLARLKELNINPYPSRSSFELAEIKKIKEKFDSLLNTEKQIAVAGRILAKREHGGSAFVDLFEGETLQIFFGKDKIGASSYAIFIETIDVGDFIAVSGKPFYTKKKEPTIEASNWEILSKSLRPLPEKWHGLQDKEETLRKRYLDILFNEESRELVRKRSVFWDAVREFHKNNGFLEVETPTLEITTGGADARPFETYHNALDMNLYLRISAGELWQKRLMVAGFSKTFEIGRIFRNEGISAEHAQDYTQCEAYWAYADFQNMHNFLRECYQFVAEKTFGTLKFQIGEYDIDLSGKWPLIDYSKEIEINTGINIWKDDDKKISGKINELDIECSTKNRARMIDALWKFCRKKIGGPAILINEPKTTSPLAKISPHNPNITERFHFIIAGSEIGQGYSELNDPLDQKERFELQNKMREEGDKEAQMADYEFIEALEYGMPPTAGHGFSERLFSFLMNKPIRETQIFPLMKPK